MYSKSPWSFLPPTEKQTNAINSYNKVYGVTIFAKTKQDAYDVISTFAPANRLYFNESFVKGTKVCYAVVNEELFERHIARDNYRLRNVVNIEVKNGMAIFTKKSTNRIDLLEGLSKLMGKMMSESSCSEYEDSLGYLDEQGLRDEMDLYGPSPMWWD